VNVNGNEGIGIGESSSASHDAVAIGNTASSGNVGSIGIGKTASSSGTGSVAIGTVGTVACTASGADSIAIGTGAEATTAGAIAIGKNADAKTGASVIAIGEVASATAISGVAIGNNAATTLNAGVSIGANSAASGYYAVALGYYAKAARLGEFALSGDSASANKAPFGIVSFYGQTTNATETELFLNNQGAPYRCTVVASSAIHFIIRVIAREPATGDCKVVEIKGGIKRNGSNTTALIGSVTSTTICEDAGASAWAVAVTADDTNESLKIAVTGEASHTINWHAVGQLIEVKD
jgi:hypothetical protein